MEFVRTDDTRFKNLAGYPFAPHYVEVPDFEEGTLRMHYVDEGERERSFYACTVNPPGHTYTVK